MHRLLERQLRRHLGSVEVPAELRAFIDAVDEAYRQSDADRGLLERSLELSSQELKQSNSQMRAMMQALPDLFLRLDANDMILDCKGAGAAAIVGPVPELFVGKRLEHTLLAPLADTVEEGRRQIADTGATVSIESTLLIGGAERWYETRLVPILEGEILALVRDITERKAAEAALREAHEELEQRVAERTAALAETGAQLLHAQKMDAIGRLAGGIAHDFNNLLTVILGRGEVVLDDLEAGTGLYRDITLIVKTAERAATLTRQLLAFSRKQVLAPKVFDLNVVVGGMIAMLQRLIGEDIELITALSHGLGAVRADPGQIEQVILNLAVNARDAMPGGGRLTIETANVPDAEEPRVVVTVRDTGHGMDEATRTRIFEPFFTTKEQGKGTGLGLATVYGIVEQSGGRIAVESAPDAGAAFLVYLPRVDDAALGSASATRTAPVSGGGETVLVVEDEDDVRGLVVDILQRAGYEVLAAASGEAALRRSAEHAGAIALLVTDMVMPRMSGPELATALATTRPDTRVVFMSGYAGRAAGQTAPRDGALFLSKPFMPRELLGKVRDALEDPRARR